MSYRELYCNKFNGFLNSPNSYDQSKFNQGIERQAKVFEKWLKQFLPPIEIKDNSLEDFIDEFE